MKGGRIAIAGVGETAYLRASPDSMLAMVVQAARRAIADAGLQPTDIDGLINSDGQPPLDEIAAGLGIEERPYTANPSVRAGAATVGALMHAQMAIEAGVSTAVLITHGAKASRPGGPYAFHEQDPLKGALEMPVGFFGQPAYFATMAQRYAHEHGLDEKSLAAVPLSARAWAALTPNAQQRKPLDFEAYLASPMIASPFRIADCCLMTDGACAYVVTSLERARDMPRPPVVVQGVGLGTLPYTLSRVLTQNADILDLPARLSAPRAYAMAGIGPADLDFAQVYDCFSISAILQVEQLGLCERGEGARFFAEGHTRPGGAMPVNTAGGHMAQGYVPGANLVIEAVNQLRGGRGDGQVAGARMGAVAGLGANAHATAILSRDDV